MFNSIKKFAKDMLNDGEKMLSRAVEKGTFKSVVFAGYLIAQADGDFDSDERAALAKIVNKELPQFDIKDIIELINECDEKVNFDKRLGTTEILDFIGGANDEDSELIMRICCFIGEADGSFDRDEKLIARDIAMRLKVQPSRYGL